MKNHRHIVTLTLLVFAGALIGIYFQSLGADFLPWDDDYNITLNLYYKLGAWKDLWSRSYYGMYIPVTSSVWAGLYYIFKGSAWPFRAFNLLLHFTNVVLLYSILKWWMKEQKIQPFWLCFAGLALFAFHPLQVETVAWISGGRDLLSTTFGFLALLCYFQIRNWKGFVFGGLLFVCSLLSKPQVASLPLVIFILQIILDSKLWKKTALQMFVWSWPVIGIAALTFNDQKEVLLKPIELWERPIVILDSFGFYWLKLLAPFHLAVDYGRTPQYLLAHLSTQWFPMVLFLALVCFFCFLAFKKKDVNGAGLFIAWVLCMLPISGIIDFAYQEISTTTDHYIYFSLAFMALLSLQLLNKLAHKKNLLRLSFVSLAIVWSLVSWNRVHVWIESQIFFEDMLQKNPHSYSAFIGLGGTASKNSDHSKSLEYFKNALAERPDDIVAKTNIASALGLMGQYLEVAKMEPLIFAESFKRALKMRHIASASFLTSLGAAAFFLNQIDISILYFCQAQTINPYNKEIEKNVDVVIKAYRKSYPGATCPRFSSPEDFLETAAAVQLANRHLKAASE